MTEVPEPGTMPVLQQLRAHTAPAHSAIEVQLGLDAALGLSRYGAIVQGFECFLRLWEPRVRGALPAQLREWFDEGRRHRFAQQDLDALALQPLRADGVAPAVGSAARALGSLYVVEGSLLGAQVIAPRLRDQLGLHAGNGAAYFAVPAHLATARWRVLRGLLDEHLGLAPACQRQQACEAANDTFRALSRLMPGAPA